MPRCSYTDGFSLHIGLTRFCEDIKLAGWVNRCHNRWWVQTVRRNVIQLMQTWQQASFRNRDMLLPCDWMLHCFIAMQHLSSLDAISWSGTLWWKRQLIQRTHFKSPCPWGWGWAERESEISMSCGQGSSTCEMQWAQQQDLVVLKGEILSADFLMLSLKTGTHQSYYITLYNVSCNVNNWNYDPSVVQSFNFPNNDTNAQLYVINWWASFNCSEC